MDSYKKKYYNSANIRIECLQRMARHVLISPNYISYVEDEIKLVKITSRANVTTDRDFGKMALWLGLTSFSEGRTRSLPNTIYSGLKLLTIPSLLRCRTPFPVDQVESQIRRARPSLGCGACHQLPPFGAESMKLRPLHF